MTTRPATPRPETLEFLAWCQNWLTEKGYEVQEKLPWKSWRWRCPTIIYALGNGGQPAFGLLAHLVNMNDLVLRMGKFMATTPRPRCIFIFVPRNSPHEVHGELKGSFSYEIEIVEGATG